MTEMHMGRITFAPTPGPWQYVGSACVDAGSGPSRFQFLLTRKGAGAPPAEWEANARLIAAAPELLEALKNAEEILRNMLGTDCEPDCTCVLHPVWAAIAKAEGK